MSTPQELAEGEYRVNVRASNFAPAGVQPVQGNASSLKFTLEVCNSDVGFIEFAIGDSQ